MTLLQWTSSSRPKLCELALAGDQLKLLGQVPRLAVITGATIAGGVPATSQGIEVEPDPPAPIEGHLGLLTPPGR